MRVIFRNNIKYRQMRTLVIWLVAVLAISLMPLEGGADGVSPCRQAPSFFNLCRNVCAFCNRLNPSAHEKRDALWQNRCRLGGPFFRLRVAYRSVSENRAGEEFLFARCALQHARRFGGGFLRDNQKEKKVNPRPPAPGASLKL